MIYIIIPVHNRLEFTIKCISSLDSQTYRNFSIIIVDDGSTDGTSLWLKQNRPDITILVGSGTLWWTGAVALGVEYALSCAKQDDFIFTLNNDVVLEKSAMEILFATSFATTGICGALSVDIDTGLIMSSGAYAESWALNRMHHPLRGQYPNRVQSDFIRVGMLTGRAVLYPIEVFRSIGNFNYKQLPHYGGDIEFTVRATNRKFGCYIVTGAIAKVNRRATGLNSDDKDLRIYERIHALFSIRSANSIFYRTVLAFKICPWYLLPSFLMISYFKILYSVVRSNN